MFTESCTCPGTCSSGPLLVVGVTNPSPSTTISSGLIPFAVLNCKSPPLKSVSYHLGSGRNDPSDVVFLTTKMSFAPKLDTDFSIVMVVVVPSPVILCITAFVLV